MAERRMFAKTIIDSDAFLDMPLSAQALYFHLSMRADDDGFINNPKKIQRMVGASDDDCKLLILKKFIITFDSGIIVIKHWKIHNYIRSDRYKPTVYIEEKAQLSENSNKGYKLINLPDEKDMCTPCIENVDKMASIGIPTVDKMDTQDRLGKDRIGKISIDYQHIADLYNDTCVSFPRIISLSENRKKAIKARLNKYTIEQVKEVFEKAEKSDFLKGGNNRNWTANFDWLMKEANFEKVIEGNYNNRTKNKSPASYDLDEFTRRALQSPIIYTKRSELEKQSC